MTTVEYEPAPATTIAGTALNWREWLKRLGPLIGLVERRLDRRVRLLDAGGSRPRSNRDCGHRQGRRRGHACTLPAQPGGSGRPYRDLSRSGRSANLDW